MARIRGKFGRKREEAIAALMTQRNVEEAARAADVGRRTLYRWLQEPDFQDAYREARRTAVGQSMARLQFASSAATSTLLKLMVNPDTPASVKARVADSILNHAMKATEIEDSEARAQRGERTSDLPLDVHVEVLTVLPCVSNAEFNAKELVSLADQRLESGSTPNSVVLQSHDHQTLTLGPISSGKGRTADKKSVQTPGRTRIAHRRPGSERA
jgi:hypothetical protein